jgi:hypothetical protein
MMKTAAAAVEMIFLSTLAAFSDLLVEHNSKTYAFLLLLLLLLLWIPHKRS